VTIFCIRMSNPNGTRKKIGKRPFSWIDMNFSELEKSAYANLKIDQYGKDTTSSWQVYEDDKDRIQSLHPVETIENDTELLLRTFSFTPLGEERQELELAIKQWLEQAKGLELEDNETKELRDFIYEMF
jgi:hypothetical protein